MSRNQSGGSLATTGLSGFHQFVFPDRKEIPVSMHKNKDNKTMHSGLRPIYYVIKMLMSIIIIILSKKELKGLK